ncbi:MAG: FixH family protein [Alphaproteobacteria bacterium]|nr:FixH family protein [Alphaproteobacteria bacterium]
MAQTTMDAEQTEKKVWDNRIPYLFFVFFAVIFAVNGYLVYLATTSWVGLVTENPYDRGLNYNQVLEAQRSQEALGFTHTAALNDIRFEDGAWTGVLSVSIQDADGQPLSGVAVVGVLERVGRFSQVFEIQFAPAGMDRFEAPVHGPLGGRWSFRGAVTAEHNGAAVDYRIAETFTVSDL